MTSSATPSRSRSDLDAMQIDRRRGLVKCYNCNRMGHILRDCKEPRRERREVRGWTMNAPKCENCGKIGHMMEACWGAKREVRETGEIKEIRELSWKERIEGASEEDKVAMMEALGFQNGQ